MDNLKVFYISTQKTTGKKLERRPDPKDTQDPEISTEEQRNLEAAAMEQSSCREGRWLSKDDPWMTQVFFFLLDQQQSMRRALALYNLIKKLTVTLNDN